LFLRVEHERNSSRSRVTTTIATGSPRRSKHGSEPGFARDGNARAFPAISTEAITVLVHYYRGELTRMISWRDRLDRTTNWAIGALAAMLSHLAGVGRGASRGAAVRDAADPRVAGDRGAALPVLHVYTRARAAAGA
jgi:hypothetical protein